MDTARPKATIRGDFDGVADQDGPVERHPARGDVMTSAPGRIGTAREGRFVDHRMTRLVLNIAVRVDVAGVGVQAQRRGAGAGTSRG